VDLPRATARAVRGSAFAATWRALYELFYFLLECLTRILFRPLFRIRRVGGDADLPAGGVLVCANHQSYLDPAMVQLALRRRLVFLMTSEFYEVPVARSVFMLLGAVPVERGRRMARASVIRVAALLRLGRAVAVFPEGRISPPGVLGPAQRGIAVLARRGRAPVVPVAVGGSARAWPKGRRWLRSADVRVAIGSPRRYEGEVSKEVDQAFADRVRDDIAALWDALPGGRGAGRPPT
jgi:1-acyl-sn-glycerol-3-phosphate acyltransferase